MDLSKLPRLSKTETAAPAEPPPVLPSPTTARRDAFCDQCGAPLRGGARFCDSCGAPVSSGVSPERADERRLKDPGIGGEAWISLALGIILIFLLPAFWKFVAHPSRTDFDATDGVTGATIPYTKSAFIWRDAGAAAFQSVLIIEGLILLVGRRRPIFLAGAAISLAAAAFDLWVVAKNYNTIGFDLVSALGVAMCGYIAFYQWRLAQPAARGGAFLP